MQTVKIRTIRNGVTSERPAEFDNGELRRMKDISCRPVTLSQLLLFMVRPGAAFSDYAAVISPDGTIVAEARRDANGNRTYSGNALYVHHE